MSKVYFFLEVINYELNIYNYVECVVMLINFIVKVCMDFFYKKLKGNGINIVMTYGNKKTSLLINIPVECLSQTMDNIICLN